MSCNGCRVLRKGCSEACVLRTCLPWIAGAAAQGHATLFLARFFGRAGLISFISAVPQHDRPALFQSLLYEACGRTVNPVGGAVELLRSGNWRLCQEAVEAVLQGMKPRLISDPESESIAVKPSFFSSGIRSPEAWDLELCLTIGLPEHGRERWQRAASPAMSSDGSVTTISENGVGDRGETRLLNLFV